MAEKTPLIRLAGNAHELGRSRAGADEDRIVAHVGEQLRDGEQLADDGVEPDLHAQLAQVVDLGIDDDVRQAEFRDAVLQHAAGDVQGLEDGDGHAVLGQIARAGQARRTRADDGRALAGAARRLPAGSSQPRPMAASATKRSSRPMATGGYLTPTTQAASHCDSCGQTRPHTAGSVLALFRMR